MEVVRRLTSPDQASSGFGSLLVQALQRTDVNVMLATVAGLSLAVALIRFAGNLAFVALEPRDDAAILR